MALYPNYRPLGVKSRWDHTSLDRQDAWRTLQDYGVHQSNGEPIEAVAWFEMDSGELRLMVTDHPNGRRITLRRNKRGFRLEMITPGDRP